MTRVLLILAGFLTQVTMAQEILIHVNGMVCSFCTQGIEKKIREIPAVSKVSVDLEKKTVTLETKQDSPLTDDEIRDAITKAGFVVTKPIERKGAP